MPEKIKAIIKKPYSQPEVTEIDNSLESIQEIVEGHYERIPFPNNKNVLILLNEEGKLRDMQPTVFVPEYIDVLVGNIIVVGATKSSNYKNLTDEQIASCMEYLNENHISEEEVLNARKSEIEAEAE